MAVSSNGKNLLSIIVIIHKNVNLNIFLNCPIFLYFQESDIGADI